MISLPLAATLVAAVLTTSVISGIFGMAGGMILLGILLFVMPVAAAMVLHGVTQLASNGARAWLWRSHIQWPVVGTYAVGASAVVVLFAAGELVPGKATVLIMLALVSFGGLLVPQRFAPDITRRRYAVGCGAVCTTLQCLAGVSGPIIDVCFVRSHLDRKQMVATKAAIQMLGHALKIGYFGQVILAGGEAVAPAAIILAIALAVAGTQLSRYVLDAISDAQFRAWTRRVIAAVAAVYLVQGLSLALVDLRNSAEAAPARQENPSTLAVAPGLTPERE